MNPAESVVYSANVRLGGGGMGNSLVELLVGLERAGLLKQVFASSVKAVPLPPHRVRTQGLLGRLQKRLEFYDPSGWASYFVNALFDRWVSRAMPPAPLFESWTGFCLESLRTARRRGSHTLLGLGSAHPRVQHELINAERRAWGLRLLKAAPLLRRIEAELAAADTVVIQSRFTERTLVEQGLPASKLVRIPLGVDARRFHPSPARRPGPLRVLCLGQVTLRKGVQYLLEAWKRLGWRDAELWIVGQVLPDFRPVQQHYASLPGVRWLGYVPDQSAAFRDCDVFVCPSVEDGFGLVVTEAMSSGLPVVVSDHTGAADLVVDGETGFVVRYNAPEEYARWLEVLRQDPGLRQRMGQAAQAAIQAHTWDEHRRRLVELHVYLLAQMASPAVTT